MRKRDYERLARIVGYLKNHDFLTPLVMRQLDNVSEEWQIKALESAIHDGSITLESVETIVSSVCGDVSNIFNLDDMLQLSGATR